MRARADRPPRPGPRGFTLLEVMIALALLLVGGVSILSVFSLAVSHRVEPRLDLVRPQARTLAQEAVDAAEPGRPPAPIVDAPTGQPGFTVSVSFARSPNDDPAWVASISISYMGTPLRTGRLPPLWLYRSALDPR
jgi:prepilin-type N-terminal cleavage/methylation domain-containing protein